MEEKTKKPILVTWDFTEKSEFAIEHGVNLAQHLSTTVTLIHIVKKDKEVDAAQEEFGELDDIDESDDESESVDEDEEDSDAESVVGENV